MDIEWIFLIIAGLTEPCWVVALGKTEKLRNVKWVIITLVFLVISMALLSLSMPVIGAGTSYAVWTGIGAVGTLIAGILLYKEPVTILRIMFILMIVIGVIGINLAAGGLL